MKKILYHKLSKNKRNIRTRSRGPGIRGPGIKDSAVSSFRHTGSNLVFLRIFSVPLVSFPLFRYVLYAQEPAE